MARGDRNAERMERSEIRKQTAKLLSVGRQLPTFDISDPDLMGERCGMCFEECERLGLVPTYGAMAIFLCTSIEHLLKIRNGELLGWKRMHLSTESAEILQKNLEYLESMFDVNFENGSYAQPVTGIFASKNLHGWKDVREVHTESVSVEITPDQISSRYESALPMHVDEHDGKPKRLMDGISAEAAAKTAAAIEVRISDGDFD